MSKRLKIGIQKIKNLFWHLPKSIYYKNFYKNPSDKLVLIGVTGTDGKTTTSELIYQTLLQCGIKAGVITTLGARIGDQNINIGLHTTSPDSSKVQKIFRQMVDEGITHAIVEVTAHALDQYRYYGCKFKIGILTNTSHEHLDDFADMNQYIMTKSKLFKDAEISILNADDQSYSQISNNLKKTKLISYSIKQPSDYQATKIIQNSDGIKFNVGKNTFTTNTFYYYQIYNILASLITIDSLDLDIGIFKKLIKNFPEIKGRREEVKNELKIKTIIDFAHTPAALKSTLESLKKITPGRLIVIFGATGGRDPSKRPLMGQVVSEIADVAVVTADDTRNEKVENINDQIISGFDQKRIQQKTFTFHNIKNRQDAFNLAIKIAQPGDTVVACGKGHETTILHGKTEYPWSESEAFRAAFRQVSNKDGHI